MGMNSTNGGEIIEVQGGHIVRSTSRKDRHSKVYTSKGPRDRRVRLAAQTAIEFYDVQDRLGYDRPSKAVDWLMKKAKTSIDKLAELPPWHPSSSTPPAAPAHIPMPDSEYRFQYQGQMNESEPQGFITSPFHTSPLDPMIPFFPKSSTSDNSISFQGYPSEMLQKAVNQKEDLCLSLHPFQDPEQESHQSASTTQALYAGTTTPMGFDASSENWSMGRLQMMEWDDGGNMQENRGGFTFNSVVPSHPPLIGQGPQFSQQGGGGALQSSFSGSITSPSLDCYRTQAAHHQSPNLFRVPGFSKPGVDAKPIRALPGFFMD